MATRSMEARMNWKYGVGILLLFAVLLLGTRVMEADAQVAGGAGVAGTGMRVVVSSPVTQVRGYRVLGRPSVSVALINQVLMEGGSPAAGLGQALYDGGAKWEIDPVFALAFFLHESSFGKLGWGAANKSLGNIRCTPGYTCQGGFRRYATWQAGFTDWYELIKVQYVQRWGLVTIAQIVPVYAPAGDHNNVQEYIAAVEEAVDRWRTGRV